MKPLIATSLQVVATAALTCAATVIALGWVRSSSGQVKTPAGAPVAAPAGGAAVLDGHGSGSETVTAQPMDVLLLISDESAPEIEAAHQLLTRGGIASALSRDPELQTVHVSAKDYPSAFELVFSEPAMRRYMRWFDGARLELRQRR